MAYIALPDPAESGESDHIGDHNVTVDAVRELQNLDATHVVAINAGANISVSRTGQTVTVTGSAASSHTHSDLIAEDVDLQSQINSIASDLDGSTPLSIALAPSGSTIVVDKARNGGATYGARPTARTDITVIWKGDTDPTQQDPNPVGPYDIWHQTSL